jgi:hypothetical protein
MALESAEGLPAYRIPQGIKKQSWAKKRRRPRRWKPREKWGKRRKQKKRKRFHLPEDVSEIMR